MIKRTEQTTQKLKELGYSVIDAGNGTTHERWKVLCEEGHERSIIPSNAIFGKNRCAVCNGNAKKSQAEAETIARSLDETLVFVGWDTLSGSYENVESRIKRKCSKCNNIIRQPLYSAMKGHGCSTCCETGFNPNKPAYFYIQELTSKDTTILR
jgi:hypothetical protein